MLISYHVREKRLKQRIAALEGENTRLQDGLRIVKGGLVNVLGPYEEEGMMDTINAYKSNCRLFVRWCEAALKSIDPSKEAT